VSLLCRLFGHKLDPYLYADIHTGAVDGIGREHASVHARCIRCSTVHQVAQVHLVPRHAEKRMQRYFTYYTRPRRPAGVSRTLWHCIHEKAVARMARDGSRPAIHLLLKDMGYQNEDVIRAYVESSYWVNRLDENIQYSQKVEREIQAARKAA